MLPRMSGYLLPEEPCNSSHEEDQPTEDKCPGNRENEQYGTEE